MVLECFIDQSHGGAQMEQRDGMVATDIAITAVRTVEPEVCEWDAELLADDELCVEPDDAPVVEEVDDDEDTAPVAVPTAIPAGDEQLPKTGVNPVLAGLVGAGLLTAGGGLVLWQRRRMSTI